jgi:hypothetical protein
MKVCMQILHCKEEVIISSRRMKAFVAGKGKFSQESTGYINRYQMKAFAAGKGNFHKKAQGT